MYYLPMRLSSQNLFSGVIGRGLKSALQWIAPARWPRWRRMVRRLENARTSCGRITAGNRPMDGIFNPKR